MSTAPIFRTFALEILDRRKKAGLRGVDHEQNRFETHLWRAPFAAKPLDQIRPPELRAWVRAMHDKDAQVRGQAPRKLSTETIKRTFSFVSAVFTAAVEDELIDMNPAAPVKIRRRADEDATKEKWTFLTLEEQRAIVSCTSIPQADRLAIRFAAATGLRQGEQFNLELRDLHVGVEKPRVFVRFGSPGKPPKSGKTRTVPLFADGLVAAREWLDLLPEYAQENPHGLVFPYHTGSRRTIGKPLGHGATLRRHLALVGITRRVRWHDLRHTFCSNLVTGVLGRRWTLEEIRPLAGHSSISITERYAHLDERALAMAANETKFTHADLPFVGDSVPAAPDTDQDLTQFDEEVRGVA